MLLSHVSKIGEHTAFVKVQVWKALKVRTHGIEAAVKGTPFYVIFLDYDNIEYETLMEKLKALQDVFELGNFYVFESGDMSYHCICIDALTPKEVYAIEGTAGVERAFQKSIFINEHHTWVLRNDEKGNRPAPKYLRKVESPYEGNNPQSLGHSTYLRKFGIKIKLKKPIGRNRVGIEGYNTSDTHMQSVEERELLEVAENELADKLKGEMERVEAIIREHIANCAPKEKKKGTEMPKRKQAPRETLFELNEELDVELKKPKFKPYESLRERFRRNQQRARLC